MQSLSELGLKVFMDAYMPVTHEERDRYPLGPPSFVSVSKRKSRYVIFFEGVTIVEGDGFDSHLGLMGPRAEGCYLDKYPK